MNEKVILTTLGRRYTKVGASFAHWSSSKDTSWFQTSSVFSSVNRDSLRRTQVAEIKCRNFCLFCYVSQNCDPTLCRLKIRTFWHLCPVLRAHKTTLLWPNWSYKKWYFVKFNPTVTSTWKNFFFVKVWRFMLPEIVLGYVCHICTKFNSCESEFELGKCENGENAIARCDFTK